MFLFAEATRSPGTPELQEFHFSVTETVSPTILRIVNGLVDGTNRVSSARIWLNGVEIVSPAQVNQNIEFLSVPISGALPDNQLRVLLGGAPESQISLVVQ